jgi:hypothetical protein
MQLKLGRIETLLQKLRRIFRRKSRQHFICGNVLFSMTPEQREAFIKAHQGKEKRRNRSTTER